MDKPLSSARYPLIQRDLYMGITELSAKTMFRERPGAAVAGGIGLLLCVDLLMKLAGLQIGPLGGSLSAAQLGSNLWNGLVIGLVIGLAGIGLSMTYSILNFANFSHGDLVSTGAFTGWGVAFLLAAAGSQPLGALLTVRDAGDVTPGAIGAHVLSTPGAIIGGLLAAFVITSLLSLAIDRAFYRPMRDRGGIALLITSVGVALVDGDTLAAPLGISITAHQLTIAVAAIGLMVAMHYTLQRTKLGTAMRAMADNKDLALITGIPAERVVTATWILGGGLAGASGYLYVLLRGTIQFDFGWTLLLLIFAAVILGGIGSIYGAIVGGLVIGVVFTTSTIWIPSDFNQAAAFAVMILMLLLRPEGLFKGVSTA